MKVSYFFLILFCVYIILKNRKKKRMKSKMNQILSLDPVLYISSYIKMKYTTMIMLILYLTSIGYDFTMRVYSVFTENFWSQKTLICVLSKIWVSFFLVFQACYLRLRYLVLNEVCV